MPSLKSFVASTVRRFLEGRRLRLLHESQAPDWEMFRRQLARHGVNIATVFDIGVASGTPHLYSSFPNAALYLFDPSPQAAPFMEAIVKARGARAFSVALGDAAGTVDFYVPKEHASATLYAAGKGSDAAVAKVEMHRFDDLVETFARPALCKIDVQGAELIVLRGMTRAIHSIDVFVLEMSVHAGGEDRLDFHTLHNFMHDSGFVLHDIVGMLRRPYDGALGQLDGIYVRADSPLRADRRWS